MAKVLQHRRGTTSENNAFIGAIGEVTYDTQRHTLRTHDGSTVGGFELALKSESISTSGGSEITQTQNLASADALHIVRDANYTGGNPGNTRHGLRVDVAVRDGVDDFEWAILGVVHNYAASGENVGVYGQGNKWGAGPTWGGVFEVRDHTLEQYQGATVGIEVDCFTNGESNVCNRIGIDVVVGKGDLNGASPKIGYGIRIGSVNGNSDNGYYDIGVGITTKFVVGFDTSGYANGSSVQPYAFRSGEFQRWAFEGTSTMYLMYGSGTWGYYNNGMALMQITNTGQFTVFGQACFRSVAHATSDSTAATAGVPVGGLYRNGNQLCIRTA